MTVLWRARERLGEDGEVHHDASLADLYYASSHGIGADSTIPVIFELVRFVKPEICVIIGSGDGLIPRVVREAQIASGKVSGRTYLIDRGETMGAMPHRIHDPKSVFRTFYPEILVMKMCSVPQGIDDLRQRERKIDILWIDGDHSYEGSLQDFTNYSPLLSDEGLIFMHDTAPNGFGSTAQPRWCGVHETIRVIKTHYHDTFEMLNFPPTQQLRLGTGFAIIKKTLSI